MCLGVLPHFLLVVLSLITVKNLSLLYSLNSDGSVWYGTLVSFRTKVEEEEEEEEIIVSRGLHPSG